MIQLWESHTFQNIWATFIFGLCVCLIAFFLRSERGKYVVRYFRKRKVSAVASMVFALFVLVGYLDSISWRDPETTRVEVGIDKNGEKNYETQISKDKNGRVIYSAEGRSVFLRICSFAGLGNTSEKSYSAPFSDHLFVKAMKPQQDGTVKWVDQELQHPGKYILGTDRVGDDVLLIALRGIRTALIVGTFTTLISLPIAILFGVIAGYFGGWVDVMIQYIYSTVGSIPYILIIAAFMTISRAVMDDEPGLFVLCLALGLTSWTGLCRLLRGETLKARELEFVQGARALGASHLRLIFKHIVPNIFHLVIITAVLNFSGYVLAEVVLSYLGIGVGTSVPSWGIMISNGSAEFTRDPLIWWNMLASFLLMMGLVLPANLFGDTLRDALDPKLRGQQ